MESTHNKTNRRPRRLVPFISSLIAILFVIGLMFINLAIANTDASIDAMYRDASVELELVPRDANKRGTGFIYKTTIDLILDSGFVSTTHYREGMIRANITRAVSNPDGSIYENKKVKFDDYPIVSFDNFAEFISGSGRDIEITYHSDSSERLFGLDWKIGVIPPVILPRIVYEKYAVADNDLNKISYLRIKYDDSSDRYRLYETLDCRISGVYDGSVNGEYPILIPASAIENWFEFENMIMTYSVANFTVQPNMNRNLDTIRDSMSLLLNRIGRGTQFIDAVVHDEELRSSVDFTENMLGFLQIFTPLAVVGISMLAAWLCVRSVTRSMNEDNELQDEALVKTRSKTIKRLLYFILLGLILGLVLTLLYLYLVQPKQMGTVFTQTVFTLALALVTLAAGVFVILQTMINRIKTHGGLGQNGNEKR